MTTPAGFTEQPKRSSARGATTGLPHPHTTTTTPTTTAQPTAVDTTKTQERP